MNPELETTALEPSDDAALPLCLLSLARQAFSAAELGQRVARLAEHPDVAGRAMAMSTIFQYLGDLEHGLALQAQAVESRQHFCWPVPAQPRLRLLAVMTPGEYLTANTPLEFLLEDADVALEAVFVTDSQPLPQPLPEHDLLFVAIGYSEQVAPLLRQLEQALAGYSRQVLNPPAAILGLSRDAVAACLCDVPGLFIPPTVQLDRPVLAALSEVESLFEGAMLPLIVRPVDSHAGRGLVRLDALDELAAYLQAQPEAAFFVSCFVDTRGCDGQYRKYRIALIAGVPYACHAAISSHWIVNYKDSGMAESAEKRAEEARFFGDFDENFGRHHATAFRAIAERTGLDYLVIDCAEMSDGRLLVFELDNRAYIHALDPVEVFPYKPPQMRRVFAAFRELLAAALSR
ncbi:MAG: RimK family alpha-L-glutamate ligase [Nitrosomonadales bacterium]|nr:RimK family alpha-L-glutamate ligase [Nitrosomonadales bacterium]